jgi:hypothetical protein
MRDPRRERRVQCVNINRNVDRPIQGDTQVALNVPHLDDFHAEPMRLRTLMVRHRSDPHLHQTVGELLFHDPRERARM